MLGIPFPFAVYSNCFINYLREALISYIRSAVLLEDFLMVIKGVCGNSVWKQFCFVHNQAKTKYSTVSCLLGRKFRVGRSQIDFIFYFIFIVFLVEIVH